MPTTGPSPMHPEQRPPPSSLGAWVVVLAVFMFGGLCALAHAEPIEWPIVYTTTASPPQIKRTTLVYDPAPTGGPPTPAPTLALSSPPTVVATLTTGYGGVTPGPADGLTLAPDGAYYVVSAPSNLHRVVTSPTTSVTFSTVSLVNVLSPDVRPPAPLGTLRLAPNLTTLWALARGGAAPPLNPLPAQGALAHAMAASPLQVGAASALIGHDGVIHDVCSVSGRTYYVGPGSAPGSGVSNGPGALGVLDPVTLQTTRLLSPLPAAAAIVGEPDARASSLVCDPLTGDLFVFGNDRVTQISLAGTTPAIRAEKTLTTLAGVGTVPGGGSVRVRAGTLDGRGRMVALLNTGQLVLIDYSASGVVSSAANVVRLVSLDTAAANLLPLSGPGAARTSEKLWDNGEFDLRNGQLSVQGPLSGDARTADDFALEPGALYRLDRVRATMFTNAPRPKARIDIYDDCNGRPGTLLGSFPATLTPTGQNFAGFAVYHVLAQTPNLWVDAGEGGRTIWVSPVGVGDANFADQWYFATSREQEVIGSAGAFKSVSFGHPDWVSVAQLPCGCTDFAFRVEGERCERLFDNGDAAPITPGSPASSIGASVLSSGQLSSAQVADDFVVSAQADVLVCALRAVVYTNCDPVLGGFNLYTTRCEVAEGAPLFSVPFSRAVDLGFDVTVDGHALRAYRVEAYDLAWYLAGNQNYALSVFLTGSGSLNQRGVWAYAVDCDAPIGPGGSPCNIRFGEASARFPSSGGWGGGGGPGTHWLPMSQTSLSPGVARAMNFQVAGRRLGRGCGGGADGTSNGNGGTPPLPSCIADVDHSGDVTPVDLFLFLDAWFAGCP